MLDFRTHSTASDGTLAPAALVDLAAALGLTGLALADHDTLTGIVEARARAQALGIRFVAGMELSAFVAGAVAGKRRTRAGSWNSPRIPSH